MTYSSNTFRHTQRSQFLPWDLGNIYIYVYRMLLINSRRAGVTQRSGSRKQTKQTQHTGERTNSSGVTYTKKNVPDHDLMMMMRALCLSAIQNKCTFAVGHRKKIPENKPNGNTKAKNGMGARENLSTTAVLRCIYIYGREERASTIMLFRDVT